MKQLILLISLLFAGNYISAQTFSEDIAPIIYDNCTTCHRAGEIGPMPLTNYSEVSQWAQTIAHVTEIKYMPPWKPDRDYSTFVGEKGLDDQEIQLIKDWVANGTPQGDPANEPPAPEFPDGSQLGTPDLVLEMTESYTIAGNNEDDYRVFVLPSNQTEDRELAAIEFRPGNSKIVHHALIAFDETGAGAAMDAATPEYGYFSYGDFGIGIPDFSTGYTPGIQTIRYPQGIGEILPANADVLVQVHYAPSPTEETDQSSLNLFFKESNDPIQRPIELSLVLPNILPNGWNDFFMPPNQVKSLHGTFPINEDISLTSIYPHAHLLCRTWEVYAVTPSNETIPLIKIDDWDFNWQGAYTFNRMQKLPEGSIMHVLATYDNTEDNPLNPNNPPAFVTWGEGTTDEMYIIALNWVPYQEGDEFIEIGGDLTNTDNPTIDNIVKLYDLVPNPVKDEVRISYYLPSTSDLGLEIFTLDGHEVKSIRKTAPQIAGNHSIQVPVNDLAMGTYLVVMETNGKKISQKLVIMR